MLFVNPNLWLFLFDIFRCEERKRFKKKNLQICNIYEMHDFLGILGNQEKDKNALISAKAKLKVLTR
jgi:hypothetical protein